MSGDIWEYLFVSLVPTGETIACDAIGAAGFELVNSHIFGAGENLRILAYFKRPKLWAASEGLTSRDELMEKLKKMTLPQ